MASSHEEQNNPVTIESDFALTGIKDAIEGTPTGIKAKAVRFFSPGEPTQRMKIIRDCVEYARTLNSALEFELQTNGLFQSFEDTKWIASNFNIVWFSLDGPASINDHHRPDPSGRGRTKEIEENMRFVSRNTSVGVRSTIVEETIDKQEMLVDYYYNLGIRNLGFNPIIRAIRRNDCTSAEVTKGNIMHFAEGFVKAYHRAEKLGMNLLSSLTFNFDEPTDIACRSCCPMPQLNPDGSVSSCDMALYGDTMNNLQCFVYGHWISERKNIIYDRTKIDFLRSRKLGNLPKCDDCDIRMYCAGGCAGRVAYQTGNIFDTIPEYCAATIYLAKNMELGRGLIKYTHP
jgi:radical SAM protein with 4Fe4S-binding SPASM domain